MVRDVIVVGGGPVGLAAAIAARLEGLAVTVVEARRPPIDKACGEGLMPAGVEALAALGVDAAPIGRPFAGIRYVIDAGDADGADACAEADFPDRRVGLGVRRTRLHAALTRRAEELGVELRFGERAERLLPAGGVGTSGGELAARFVVGADGLRSKVRAWAALEGAPSRRPRRFGVRRHLDGIEPASRVEVVFGRDAEAYLTPLAGGETGVALLWRGEGRGGFDELLATRFSPAFGARLAGARPSSRDLGAGPFHVRARAAARGRVALVGDAAGYLDALTGEGLSLGFREALALAPVLRDGDLPAFARASTRARRLPEALTRLALALAHWPPFGRRLVAGLAREPAAFAALLGALGCGRPATSLLRPPLLRLAVELARRARPRA